jgi:hypothetical protein
VIDIGIGKNQCIWVKEQTGGKGVIAWPTASDAILLTGDGNFKQERDFRSDKQKRMTVGELGRIAGVYKPGDFSFPIYVKAAGSLGIEPPASAVLKAFFDKVTATPSTKVEYTLGAITDDIVYLTVIFVDNFETWVIQDLAVSKGTMKFIAGESDESILGLDVSGPFLRSYFAGTDALASAINGTSTPVTAIPAVDASKFEPNSKIVVGTNTNSGAGFTVTAINTTTNIITITPGVNDSQGIGAVIKGWTPAIVESGYLINSRFGMYQEKIGGGSFVDKLIVDATFEMDKQIKVLNNEKTGSGYPASMMKGDRKLSLSLNQLMTKDGGVFRYQANNQIQKQIKLPAGDVAGYRARLEFPNVQFDSPAKSGEAERSYSLKGTPFETASLNDAVKLIFD